MTRAAAPAKFPAKISTIGPFLRFGVTFSGKPLTFPATSETSHGLFKGKPHRLGFPEKAVGPWFTKFPAAGIRPLRSLWVRSRLTKIGRFPKVSGIPPENLLQERFKVPEIWLSLPISFGIEPLNWLSDMSRWVRLVRFPMAGKSFPMKKFWRSIKRRSEWPESEIPATWPEMHWIPAQWHGVSWVSFQEERTSFGSLVMADLRARRERPSRFREREGRGYRKRREKRQRRRRLIFRVGLSWK
ncbi:hypothetical protein AMTRI_Chr03g44920 [Amborella trichopoda]